MTQPQSEEPGAAASGGPASEATPGMPGYRRDLGSGFVLRWSTPEDAGALAALVAGVFGSPEWPGEADRRLVHEMTGGRYPFGGPGDWALVEETDRGRIVAAAGLMGQTWTYDGIPLPVGRPEPVVTHRDYRDRGFVRAIFSLLHARSTARGDLAQVIDGIPYFYRQFGYEYALESFGGRRVHWSAIAEGDAAEGDAAEGDAPYRLREAGLDDAPLLARLYAQEQADSLVSVRADEAYWRWVLDGQDHTAEHGWRPLIVCDAGAAGAGVGYVVLRDGYHWGDPQALAVVGLAVERHVSLWRVLPPVLRALKAMVPSLPRPMIGHPPLRLLLLLGRDHPAYAALDTDLAPSERRPYAWYVRVPDLAALLRRLAPSLERRLVGSLFEGHRGALQVDFYRGALTLRFAGGRLEAAEERAGRASGLPGETGGPGAAMPRPQFLQLLFGYRSIVTLRDTFPDVSATDEALALLATLFPERMSRPLVVD